MYLSKFEILISPNNFQEMLSTESRAWNCLQALKSRLAGRLVKFTRKRTSDSRPDRLQNNASFLEVDLRYIFAAMPVVVDFSENHYNDMDQMAGDLLASLDDMVNEDRIKPLQPLPDCHHEKTIFGDRYRRLGYIISFLDTSAEQCNLMTGSGPLLFTLSHGQAGRIAMDRIAKWKAFLECLAIDAGKLQSSQALPQLQTELTEKLTNGQSRVHQKRASIVVNTIFKEFQRLTCGECHEIKLKVTDEWQIGSYGTPLDMFISCCPDRDVWQQAKCGSFQYV